MYVAGLLLFVVHIVAFVAGGANSVVMPVIGQKMATASPDARVALSAIAEHLAKVGKYALATLLVSGVLVLWLKWNWVVPNAWFWVKMALVAAMVVIVGINEGNARKARAGDREAVRQAALLGKLASVAFLGVIISAVLAFN